MCGDKEGAVPFLRGDGAERECIEVRHPTAYRASFAGERATRSVGSVLPGEILQDGVRRKRKEVCRFFGRDGGRVVTP